MAHRSGPDSFHPAVAAWFERTSAAATPAQREAWTAIRARPHALISAPTCPGRTLAALLAAIDGIVSDGVRIAATVGTCILYRDSVAIAVYIAGKVHGLGSTDDDALPAKWRRALTRRRGDAAVVRTQASLPA